MKIVRVTYTTKTGFAEQNMANIRKVMSDLQAINNHDMSYTCTLSEDGKTFTHLAFFNSAEAEKVLLALPAFKTFQEQLKASGPEAPPKQDFPTFVGSSIDLFR
jgi:hypothetical protein